MFLDERLNKFVTTDDFFGPGEASYLHVPVFEYVDFHPFTNEG
jgi:hypothetical protein